MQKNNQTIFINAAEMVTSVGWDSDIASAAIRAGMSRPKEIDAFKCFDPGIEESVGITGHPVAGLTTGFYFIGRWIVLCRQVLANLINHKSISDKESTVWEKTGFIFIVPNLESKRYESMELSNDILYKDFAEPVLSFVSGNINSEYVKILHDDHCGAASGIITGREMIQSGSLDRVFIIGVDSFFDRSSVNYLDKNNRIKTPEKATGLSIGEGAGCFIISKNPAPVLSGRIVVDDLSGDNLQYINGVSSFASIIKKDLKQTDVSGRFSGSIYTDHNGENWKALTYGTLYTNLTESINFDDSEIICPGESVGETGCASSFISLCSAYDDLERGCSVSDTSIVFSLSDAGKISSLMLEKQTS